ncbi:MAG: ATPase, T2SS/T4P/T4SS family, partial [Chloroflexales bacterium]
AQSYLDDARVQEVKINGTQIMVQEDGSDFVIVPERFAHPDQPLQRALLLSSRLQVPINENNPQGTLPLAHGTRMHVTAPPCTPKGVGLICIRRGRSYAWVLDDIYQRGGFSAEIRDLLLLFARAKCSFLIAGETGCGKTALLESIVNSWPGQPHVITIEDNTLEINVKHAAWTRELVRTNYEPRAFGRAAKEALRQTPTVVAPGETRAEEAGAILTIAVSGHAILTTLHAKSCQAAIQRFADCAAMPGSYIYEGRRGNALDDACDNIEVVIHIEKMGGRRFISEIVLLNGVVRDGASVRPRMVTLTEMQVHEDGTLTWPVQAVAEGDVLRWVDGPDRTPSALAQKFRLLKAERQVRSAPTTRAAVEDALVRAQQAVQSGQIELALATLRRAWVERHDPRLVTAAAYALETDSERMAAAAAASDAVGVEIDALLRRRQWGEARLRLEQAQADLVLTAATFPAGRWEALRAVVDQGQEADREVLERAGRARRALDSGTDSYEVLVLLGREHGDRISSEAARFAVTVRRDALRVLVDRGEVEPRLLDAAEA